MSASTARPLSASVGAEADRRYSPGRATEGPAPAASVAARRGRIYLDARDTRSPDAARRSSFEAISDWQATEVKNALGQRFRATARVVLRRPWWMPGPLYRALLRSVVVESHWEQRR